MVMEGYQGPKPLVTMEDTREFYEEQVAGSRSRLGGRLSDRDWGDGWSSWETTDDLFLGPLTQLCQLCDYGILDVADWSVLSIPPSLRLGSEQ